MSRAVLVQLDQLDPYSVRAGLLDNGCGLVAQASSFFQLALDQAGFRHADVVKRRAP